MRTVRLGLVRKTGYFSEYSLSMVYPSWEAGVWYGSTRGGHIPPVAISLSGANVVEIPAWALRFPSWLARKMKNRDRRGQVKSSPELPMPWKLPENKASFRSYVKGVSR